MNIRPVPFATAVLAAAGMVLAGRSSMSVQRDHDEGFSFAGLSAWAWLEISAGQRQVFPEGEARVREAVREELARRGTADHTVYDTCGYGTGRWWGYGNTTDVRQTETEGELVIDISRTPPARRCSAPSPVRHVSQYRALCGRIPRSPPVGSGTSP